MALENLEYMVIDDCIIRDINITPIEFSAYIAIRMMLGGKPVASMLINPTSLSYMLSSGSLPVSRKSNEQMKQGIDGLQHKTNLPIINTPHQSIYCVHSKEFFIFKEYGTKVSIKNIETIMISKHNNRKALLKYYTLLLSLLAGKKENGILAARWTIEEISKRSGLYRDTVVAYNKALANLQLIYFYDKYIFDNDGKCKSTIFSTWKNQKHVQRYISTYYPNGIVRSKEETNQKRAYATKYRWLCQGKQYDQDTILAIKEYVVAHNQKIQDKLNNPNLSDKDRLYWSEKLLDETIFERL